MISRTLLFSFIVLLFGCITTTNMNTGVSQKLTLAGFETIVPIDEKPREKLPSLKIEKYGSGFTVNETNYYDPQGSVIHLSEISDTGFVTYTIQGHNESEQIVKLVNPLKRDAAKVLGVLDKTRAKWHYQPKGEKRYSGDWFRLASRGVLLNENNNIVTYFSPDHPIKTHVLPEGFSFTSLQKGDLSKSLHLLIQKPREVKTYLGVVTFQTLARHFDFILFDLLNGNTTAEIYDVRLRGDTDDKQMGHLNVSYYLFNTASGTIVVTLEDGYQRFVIRNLTTGQKKIAFEREHGVSYTQAKMHSSGRIELKASLGFSNDKILDVENYLATGHKNKQLGE